MRLSNDGEDSMQCIKHLKRWGSVHSDGLRTDLGVGWEVDVLTVRAILPLFDYLAFFKVGKVFYSLVPSVAKLAAILISFSALTSASSPKLMLLLAVFVLPAGVPRYR